MNKGVTIKSTDGPWNKGDRGVRWSHRDEKSRRRKKRKETLKNTRTQ